MPDVSILLPDADAPTGYTVPSTSEIIPKAASAIIDGTSATTAFYPVLEIVSDGGHVVAQARAAAIAAGGSAEVSWFPRVAAASGLVSTVTWAYLPGTAKTFAANGGSGSATTIFSGDTSFPGFYTNAASVFTTGTYSTGGNTYTGLSVQQPGHYLFWAYFYCAASVTLDDLNYTFSYAQQPLSESSWETLPTSQVLPGTLHNDEVGRQYVTIATAQTSDTYPLGPVIYQATNYTNVGFQAAVNVIAVMLDGDGTGI